jgi:glycosyltransferase involved in cell wall biosynthesis
MISVITPVFNGERFIENCIKTVIDQHCPHIEHIIVDGCSSDSTIEIIKQYAAQYSHIRWISEKDQGQSDAMNKGIRLAKGDILGILNVDDYYAPNTLNRVLEIFQNLPEPSFLAGNCNVWDTNGMLAEINKPSKLELFHLLIGIGVNPYPYNPSAYFYHRSLHEIIGFYKIDDHYSMDLDFILRAVQKANLKYVNEIFGNYRRVEGTKTVEDAKSGKIGERVEKIFATYRQQLPVMQRWFIVLREEGIGFTKRLKRVPRKLRLKLSPLKGN